MTQIDITLRGTDDAVTITVFLAFAISYAVYYTFSHARGAARYFEHKYGRDRGSVRYVVWQRAILFCGAGLIPAFLIRFVFDVPLSAFGISLHMPWQAILAAAGVTALSTLVSTLMPKTEKNYAAYPQIRRSEWNAGTVTINTITWFLYLVAYEAMFRGFLLYALLPYGIWTAVAVNIALYVATHVPKGASEAAGALVYSPVLCLLTLWSGSIWIAVFAHTGLALGNSYSTLATHPEMKLVGRRSSNTD